MDRGWEYPCDCEACECREVDPEFELDACDEWRYWLLLSCGE